MSVMKIVLQDDVVAGVVAHELQQGKAEGVFVVGKEGTVFYHHPYDPKAWKAGADVRTFRSAVIAFSRYQATVAELEREEAQLRAVADLRVALSALGVLGGSDGFWDIILEQAEDGFL